MSKSVPKAPPLPAAKKKSLCDSIVGVQGLNLVRLRQVAKKYKIAGYSKMRKEELCAAIKKAGDEKLKFWMQDVCIREAVMKAAEAQEFLEKNTKAGRARGKLRYMPYFTDRECSIPVSQQLQSWIVLDNPAVKSLNSAMRRFGKSIRYLYAMWGEDENTVVEEWNLKTMKEESKTAYRFFRKYLGKSIFDAQRDGLVYLFSHASEQFRKEFFEHFYPGKDGDEHAFEFNPWICYPHLKHYPCENRVLEQPNKSPYKIAQPREEYRAFMDEWKRERDEKFYSARSAFSSKSK